MEAHNRIKVEPGTVFGMLTVVRELPKRKDNPKQKNKIYYLCRCRCGRLTEVESFALRHGGTLSCGCLQRKRTSESNRTHGMCRTALYRVYRAMRRRCYAAADPAYANYGGRGITVCDAWLSSFACFAEWANSNGYAEGLTIDRIDNNLGYSPDNCRWVSPDRQARNRRMCVMMTVEGRTVCLAEAARHHGVVKPTCAQARVRAGWDPLTAVTAPPRSIRHKTETPVHEGGIMHDKIVVMKTVLKSARRNETLEDVAKAMREYADAMDVRQKEAVDGDRYLSCGCVALRMREFARRMENAARRRMNNRRPCATPILKDKEANS